MRHLLDHSPAELEAWLSERDQPRYRAAQIWRWVFARRAQAFDEMTDLPRALRSELEAQWRLWTAHVVRHRQAADGTEKLLIELADGQRIECVLIREGPRRTVCVSTQVGCAMGCVFCASGLDGLVRNLSTGEILEQLLRVTQLLDANERLSHIVVMGMGEPLANLSGLLPALDVAASADGLGISARRITISTVGLPAAIERLAREGRPFHLAVSLHAPEEELRQRLVPVSRKIRLVDILAAVDTFFATTGRRPTFEYVLLGGVNDAAHHAKRLADLLAGRAALVNLIPYNPVAGLPYETPSAERVERFVSMLRGAGVNVQIRRRKGDRIDAACGQLRRLSVELGGSDALATAIGS